MGNLLTMGRFEHTPSQTIPNIVSHSNVHYVVSVLIIGQTASGERGVLYLKRSNTDEFEPGRWGVVTDHIESGERAGEALIRGVKEEAGIHINGKEFGAIITLPIRAQRVPLDGRPNTFVQGVSNVYYVLDPNLTINGIKISEEHTEARFFSLLELMELRKARTIVDPKLLLRGEAANTRPRLTTFDRAIIDHPRVLEALYLRTVAADRSIAEQRRMRSVH
jgi:ADP-ribose pyrophosphatase YjhB (NUDIX family)